MESFNYIRALIWLLFLNGILFRGTKSKLYLRNSPIKIQFNETNNEDLLAKGKWSKARQLCADKNQRLLVITSSLKEEAKRYMNRTAFINAHYRFWIGLHRRGGQIKWINGDDYEDSGLNVPTLFNEDGDLCGFIQHNIQSMFIGLQDCNLVEKYLCDTQPDVPSTEPVTTSKQIVGEGSGDEETDVSQSTLASTTPDSTGSGDDTGPGQAGASSAVIAAIALVGIVAVIVLVLYRRVKKKKDIKKAAKPDKEVDGKPTDYYTKADAEYYESNYN